MPVPMAGDDMSVDETRGATELTAQDEKEIVKELTDRADSEVREGDTSYLISCRWWRLWQQYADPSAISEIGEPSVSSTSDSGTPSAKRPFSIDNADLVVGSNYTDDHKTEPALKESLSEDNDYNLLPEQVWLKMHEWYGGGPTLARKVITLGIGANAHLAVEVYPLQLHILVAPSGTKATLTVSRKATVGKLHQLICDQLKLDLKNTRIWDHFNGQKGKQFADNLTVLEEASLSMNHDILVELQVNGKWPDEATPVGNGSAGRKSSVTTESRSIANGPSASRVGVRHASAVQYPLYSTDKDKESDSWSGSSSAANTTARTGPKGLTGLQNLGNTCFMNSALQCLVHTAPLVNYFTQDYSQEINRQNPLGMQGELAIAFGDLLRKLWAGGKQPVAPRPFKTNLARFAPQFSGYNQHDSQELLAFLLDGLHEDLNRVKHKPYVEAKDSDGRPDQEVANEYWANHRSRNDSVIVDVCQGQYKSTLVCPECKKVSVMFDPFMYLSLPLPAKTTRTMTVTVFSGDGSALPTSYTVTVPRQGRFKDLLKAVGAACNLGTEERLLLVELYNHRIFRVLEEPLDWLTAIRDDDKLAAYRLPKLSEKGPLLVLLHRRLELETYSSKNSPQWKLFAAPLITYMPDEAPTGADLTKVVHNLLRPVEKAERPVVAESMELEGARSSSSGVEDVEMSAEGTKDSDGHCAENGNSTGFDTEIAVDEEPQNEVQHEEPFQLWTTDEKGTVREGSVLLDKPVPPASSSARGNSKMRFVAVDWSANGVEEWYDMSQVDMPPEVLKTGLPASSSKKARQESVSLYICMESFLKEEPLGPEDMWYCPGCKQHRQASKKLDLWRLPEVLVVHLKRFSYSRFQKNKLETFVNFPLHDLDLTKLVANKSEPQCCEYELFAVSNHYGSMGGGHYTAYAKLIDEDKWYNFDDSQVTSVAESDVKTSAAYVLFYRRIPRKKSTSIDEQENGARPHALIHRDSPIASETGSI